MQQYQVIPSHASITHLSNINLDKKNPGKEFFKYMQEYYDKQNSELIYIDENLVKVICYDINNTLIFVANKPFQKGSLSSVVISKNNCVAYLIKMGLEKQTGFKLLGHKNGNKKSK